MFEEENVINDDADEVQAEDEQSVSVALDNPSAGVCQGCHETFYQIQKPGTTNEWHYRNAVQFKDHNYHPECLKDKIKVNLLFN